MSLRRVSVVLLAAALTAAAASTPVVTAGAAPSGPFVGKHSLRAPVTDETFYFVMADRFENGDTDNDTGGISGDVNQHGFDPTNMGFYQGGDLKGLLDQIDYIQGLGTTSIWLTRSFKNRPYNWRTARRRATTATGSLTSLRSTRTWAPMMSFARSSTRRTRAE